MKRIISCVLISICVLTLSSTSYADVIWKSCVIIEGHSSLMESFKVKKNEVVHIECTNKSDGRVLLFIEDEAGNRVRDVMTLNGATNRDKKDSAIISLPKGKYYIRAKGGHNIWNGNDSTTGKFIIKLICKRL